MQSSRRAAIGQPPAAPRDQVREYAVVTRYIGVTDGEYKPSVLKIARQELFRWCRSVKEFHCQRTFILDQPLDYES